MIYGIDGYRGGWVLAAKNPEGGEIQLVHCQHASEFKQLPAQIIAIDIPIGLRESGTRECDLLARKRLEKRASSVFPAPLRPMLPARNYREACDIRFQIEGKKISKQTFNILEKIRQVDEILQTDVNLRNILFETHPEVCFRAMNGNIPLEFNKKTPQGKAMRRELLGARFGPQVGEILSRPRAFECGEDDILDAFATLWTAEQVLRGEHETLPARPPLDSTGLLMRIVV
jgi:predicted RNase H-like nuclease